jgi:formylglycine-generating enzyme required for sulfatase activity
MYRTMKKLGAVVPKRPQNSATEVSCHTNMIWIPGGTFNMGSDRHYADEAPVHRVTIDPFWIDIAPVPIANSAGSLQKPAMSPSPKSRRTRITILALCLTCSRRAP